MGLRIKTNVGSLMAQRQLATSTQNMQDSIQKLSSGYRINKSADDAAGLAVSESMKAKVRSLAVAKRNASDGISYLQVAEGGLGEVNNMMVRMRELTTQAASDTLGSKERSFLNREFVELTQEVLRVVDETEFNGQRVLKPNETNSEGVAIQVGSGFTVNGETSSEGAGVITINLEQVEELNDALTELESLSIEGDSGQELGNQSTSSTFATIDSAMEKVTDFRATIGALQSRMGSAITSIDVSMENMDAAQSRIRDVDYASETAKLTQSRILSAAGTSVLSQANSLPESVLSLLR